MKIKRPLINPEPEDLIQENILEEKNREEEALEKKDSKDQLVFNINSPKRTFVQRFSFLRMSLRKRNELFEISSIWKSPALAYSIVSMFSIALTLIFVIIFEFDNKIPPKIPFLYNSIEKHWEQSDKSILVVILILLMFTEITIIGLNIRISPKDKRLGFTLNWVLTLINILFLMFIIQIHYLIT